MDPQQARKDPVAGGANFTTRQLLLSHPFNSRWFMDPLLTIKDPVARRSCMYHHQVVIA
jgi:hypothetical protein